MKSLKNTQGFSLVELMVVVAIIGILAALSVGQVTKQIAKSRQSEVKTNLAGLYTAEKSIFAEFASYTGDFGQLAFGYEGNLRYDVGFGANTPTLTQAANGYTGKAPSTYSMASTYCKNNKDGAGTKQICTVLSSNGLAAKPPTTAALAGSFVAEGHAYIFDKNADDIWQITDAKLITNSNPGIP